MVKAYCLHEMPYYGILYRKGLFIVMMGTHLNLEVKETVQKNSLLARKGSCQVAGSIVCVFLTSTMYLQMMVGHMHMFVLRLAMR